KTRAPSLSSSVLEVATGVRFATPASRAAALRTESSESERCAASRGGVSAPVSENMSVAGGGGTGWGGGGRRGRRAGFAGIRTGRRRDTGSGRWSSVVGRWSARRRQSSNDRRPMTNDRRQYLGMLGSISSDQARIPPSRLRTLL